MAAVQAERTKLRRMKHANEQHLREDMEDIQDFMTPSNLFNALLGRMAGGSPSMANVIAGVQTAVSLFRGRRHSCGC